MRLVEVVLGMRMLVECKQKLRDEKMLDEKHLSYPAMGAEVNPMALWPGSPFLFF